MKKTMMSINPMNALGELITFFTLVWISNWKEQNTYLTLRKNLKVKPAAYENKRILLPPFCHDRLSDHGEAQRIISRRNRIITGNVKCTKQKEIEQQENTCPSFCPFLLWKSIRKRKQGNKKKRVKQRGSQTIFYSMPFLNKNIVHRSKVYLCTAVVWGKKIHFWGLASMSCQLLLEHRLCTVLISRVDFKGLFWKVVNASAMPMMLAWNQKHLPIITDPLGLPSFTKWRTSSCKGAAC